MFRRWIAVLIGLMFIGTCSVDALAAPNRLLLITANGSLSYQENLRKNQFEAWGYVVSTLVDSSSQGSYDAAVAVNDVVYVSEEVSSNSVGYKLREATIGVVYDEGYLVQEFGVSNGNPIDNNSNDIYVTDNSHAITTGFALGNLVIGSTWLDLVRINYALAPGAQTLATLGGDPAVVAIETGAQLVNTYNGSNTAFGRRVHLPYGQGDFNFSELNSNGLQLTLQAIQWAAGSGGGLVGHWKLDDASGTTAADSTTNNNDGTVYGGANWSTRCSGVGVFDFNGTSNYVQVPNNSSLQITDELTITAWIKGNSWSTGTDVDVIVRKGEGNPNNYQLTVSDGVLTLYLDDSDGNPGYQGDTVLDTGNWYHVAAVWDGTEVKLYVNGEMDHATPYTHTAPIGTDTRPLYIGGRSGTDYFDGMIYDVRLYDVALTESEISEQYGVLGHWKLDETSGSTAADSSPLGNDGTVVGTPNWTTGQIDGAIQLNGSNYIEIPGLMGEQPNITVAAWVNLTAADVSGSEVFSLGDCFALRLDNGTSTYSFYWNGSTWNNTPTIVQSFEGTGWHHVAVVFDDDNDLITLYVDGVAAGSTTVTDSIDYTGLGSNTTLGAHGNGSGSFDFTGMIDDVYLFNRALCPGEIQELESETGFAGIRITKWVEVQ